MKEEHLCVMPAQSSKTNGLLDKKGLNEHQYLGSHFLKSAQSWYTAAIDNQTFVPILKSGSSVGNTDKFFKQLCFKINNPMEYKMIYST